MNIKSLLLGSAAALAVVSGAHAADAIVAAEPEPLEYVRICDAYGAGYFYIPGSETCLKIGGMVRTQAQWKDAYDPESHFGTNWLTRAELNIDTATDTEYGPLKTNMVFRFNSSEGVNNSQVLFANISLGGFLVGKYDSQFDAFSGYAGNVINDDVIGYGKFELNQLTYTYNGGGQGFSAVVSVEDSDNGIGPNGEDARDHYAPDGVVGIGYKAGIFTGTLVGGYDSVVDAGTIKGRVQFDFTSAFSAFLMGAYNTEGDKISRYSNGDITDGVAHSTGDWAAWGGTTYKFTDKLEWNTEVAYADDKTFEATTNVNYFITKGFKVQPEVTYVRYDNEVSKHDVYSGILRFQRNF